MWVSIDTNGTGVSGTHPSTKQVGTTRGNILGQLIFCEGCCCGRTDRGFPEFPKTLIKSIWKDRKLNRHIQLTVSGCLGPCDTANVACFIRADGEMTWLGQLKEADYDSIISWAIACQESNHWHPLPKPLALHKFDRFAARENHVPEEDAANV
jgi:cobaltochelatase CobN